MPLDPKAAYACVACRRLKRKCSRDLPACSLCARLRKACEYSPQALAGVHNGAAPEKSYQGQQLFHDTRFSTGRSDHIAGLQQDSLPFPLAFFLDLEQHELIPRNAQIGILPPSAAVLETLGDESDILFACHRHFQGVQGWLPFLSEKRVLARVYDRTWVDDSQYSLLMLAVRMVSEQDPVRQAGLYAAVKELQMRLEQATLPSLELLQCLVLTAVHEIGQAIYPAAYLTIGQAARFGILLGYHDRGSAPQLYKLPDMWTKGEEERRTWWAVIVLDRVVNLGIPRLPLATPEPIQGDSLPCHDARWKRGEIGFNEPLFATSFADDSGIGPFASTCQAAHVLGRVLHHRNTWDGGFENRAARFSAAMQLHRTLVALDAALVQKLSSTGGGDGANTTSDGDPEDASETVDADMMLGDSSTAVSLCCSARLILYNIYACSESYLTDMPRLGEERSMQQMSMQGIDNIIRSMRLAATFLLNPRQGASPLVEGLTQEQEDVGELLSRLLEIGPLVCHALYQTASECAWLIREQENAETAEALRVMVGLLSLLSRRWRVADEYIKLLRKDNALVSLEG